METCPAGQRFWHIPKDRGCPSLFFSEETAFCGLVEFGLVPVGDGCCLKARLCKAGVEYVFASLPPVLKHNVAESLKKEMIVCRAMK